MAHPEPHVTLSEDSATEGQEGQGWSVRLLMLLIRGYRKWISPLLPPSCRFYPTCSQYALTALAYHGLWKGGWLSARRLLRCHPFHPGGVDPVPRTFHFKSSSRF